MNHYPLIGRKVPGSCNDQFGTADPFAHIDCPKCRERIAAKIAAEATEAGRTRNTQEQRFHAGTAAMFARVLKQAA